MSACYIRNRSPASGVARTPWEEFFNQVPDVFGMRAFGARVYTLIPHQQRRKLDPHSRRSMRETPMDARTKATPMTASAAEKTILTRRSFHTEN
jgi:hypothetical protein